MNQHLAQDVFRQQCDKEGLEHQLESNSRLNQFVKILPKVDFGQELCYQLMNMIHTTAGVDQ